MRTRSPGRTAVEYCTSTSASLTCRLSAIELQEPAVFPDELAVCIHLAFGTQVADQVPVQARGIAPAELLEARAEREVHRAADLLVEQEVAGEDVDLVI